MLEYRGKEEVDKDFINEALAFNDVLTHFDVKVIDDLASKLNQSDIDSFKVLICRSIHCI